MIVSQQPMMLNSALAFERIIKDPKAGALSSAVPRAAWLSVGPCQCFMPACLRTLRLRLSINQSILDF